jgi:catechol 2,3-dioxygenase-like lactoylglutathione lyase family enzyme
MTPEKSEAAMIKVRRLGHATISTPNFETQTDYYGRVLGLQVVERSKDRVFLASKQGLEAIELVKGEAGVLQRLSFQIAPGTDLNDVVKELGKLGIKSQKRSGISPGVAEAVSLVDSKGTPIDLYAEYKFAAAGQPASFNILKLGHVAYRVLDVQSVVKFYTEVLGFRVSDWRGDYFVFMRCNTDHHSLNFIIDEKPQLHHIAFEVLDWSEINKAGDWLARNKIHLVWGPGRHIIGHNAATYHRNDELVRVEIFTEMDQMKDEALGYFDPRPWHQEFPLYPKLHGPETLRNYWGYGSERVIQGYQTNEQPKYEAIRG